MQWVGITDGHGRVARKEAGMEARGCGLGILVKNQDFSPKSFGEPFTGFYAGQEHDAC